MNSAHKVGTAGSRVLMFIDAASKAAIELETIYEFDCPLCGEKAKAARSSEHGHIHAMCSKCRIKIMV